MYLSANTTNKQIFVRWHLACALPHGRATAPMPFACGTGVRTTLPSLIFWISLFEGQEAGSSDQPRRSRSGLRQLRSVVPRSCESDECRCIRASVRLGTYSRAAIFFTSDQSEIAQLAFRSTPRFWSALIGRNFLRLSGRYFGKLMTERSAAAQRRNGIAILFRPVGRKGFWGFVIPG